MRRVGRYFSFISCFLYHRSGTEEQYGELHQLLDDASAYITDMQNNKATKKAKNNYKKTLIEAMQRDLGMMLCLL